MTQLGEVTVKDKFLDAIINGDIGADDGFGVTVTLKEFQKHFKDEIDSGYIGSFLPAAVMDGNQEIPSHTKYLKRAKKGIYRVHKDAIEEHKTNKSMAQNQLKQDPISKGDFESLQKEAKRTHMKGSAIFSKINNPPENMTAAITYNILSGKRKNAPPEYISALFAAYANQPDKDQKPMNDLSQSLIEDDSNRGLNYD